MLIGIARETKQGEKRVALTPSAAKELSVDHKIRVESKAGAEIAGKEVWESDLLVKVKEPAPTEFSFLKRPKKKVLFSFLHLSANKELALELLNQKITSLAYELVEENHELPILKPMSSLAGALAIQYASQFLQAKYGGKGITLSGKIPAHIAIVGGGTVGSSAAQVAARIGCKVKLLELSKQRIEELRKIFKAKLPAVKVLKSEKENLTEAIEKADVLIGAVYKRGSLAPKVVTKEMVKSMESGSVIIDVSIDQGGCVWGSKPKTHSNPIFKKDGKIYCCIQDMPGQVPQEASLALSEAALPFIKKLANEGPKALPKAICTHRGKIANKTVAKSLKLEEKFRSLIFPSS